MVCGQLALPIGSQSRSQDITMFLVVSVLRVVPQAIVKYSSPKTGRQLPSHLQSQLHTPVTPQQS